MKPQLITDLSVGVETTRGPLLPDEDGYFDIVVGSAGNYNSVGSYYEEAPYVNLISKGSDYHRMLVNGNAYGELGHPTREPRMSDAEWLARILIIREENWSTFFREVYTAPSKTMNKDGKPFKLIRAKVKGAGKNPDNLKNMMLDKYQNVCYSLRALSFDYIDNNGRMVRRLKRCVCYDQVGEPGMADATKHGKLVMEQLIITDKLVDETTRILSRENEAFEAARLDAVMESVRQSVEQSHFKKPSVMNW